MIPWSPLGKSHPEVMPKPDLPEIVITSIDSQNSRNRRNAALVGPNGISYARHSHFHPPEQGTTTPGKRRRPPPPPPLLEEMFQNQYETQHVKTVTPSRYSSAARVKGNVQERYRPTSKTQSQKPYIDSQSNNKNTIDPHFQKAIESHVQKVIDTHVKHNLRPSPLTSPFVTTVTTTQPTTTTAKAVVKTNYKPNPIVKAIVKTNYKPKPIVQAIAKTNYKPNPSVQSTEPKTETAAEPNVEPYLRSEAVYHEQTPMEQGANGVAGKQVPQEAAANRHDYIPRLELGESPKEALNVEASLELNSLLGLTNMAHDHLHAQEHAQEHAHHGHANGDTHTHAQPTKTRKATQIKPKKTVNSNLPVYPVKQASIPSKTTKTESKGPSPDVEAKFVSMFDAWYQAKFDTTKQPATTAPPVPKSTKAKQTQPPASKGYIKAKKQGPKTNSVDKTALFQEFMSMFKDQMYASGASPTTTTVKPTTTTTRPTTRPTTTTTTRAPYVSKTKVKSGAAIRSGKSSARTKTVKYPKSNTDPVKVKSKSSLKVTSKSTTPGTYSKLTTKTLLYTGKQAATTTVDPTQVKLVTLSHPENLSLKSNGKNNVVPHVHKETVTTAPTTVNPPTKGAPARSEVLSSMNIEGVPNPYAGRRPRPGPVKTKAPRNITTTPRPMPDPDMLADINEIRVMKGLPELLPHQVDVHGNLLPMYKRQMRIGRLPTRQHPLLNPGGLFQNQNQYPRPHQHHPLQHQHSHPDLRPGSGLNSFPNMLNPQNTNNRRAMTYEPFPSPHNPVPAPAPPKNRAAGPAPNPVNVASIPGIEQLNPLAYFYFINALNSMFPNQPNGGGRTLYNQNGPNGMLGPNAYNQQGHNNAAPGQSANNINGNGEHMMDLHHQAIHMEAGNAMTPNLHRQVHRLLRQRQMNAQRQNLFGMRNRPVTANPVIFDPDLLADLYDAQQAAMSV